MKKIAVLMFIILILGCETETPVVEESLPVVMEDGALEQPDDADSQHPGISLKLISASVRDGDVDAFPQPLNQDGIRFEFNTTLHVFKIDIFRNDEPLDWLPRGVIAPQHVADTLTIKPVAGSELQFDTEYEIKIYVQDRYCFGYYYRIRFRTTSKPHFVF